MTKQEFIKLISNQSRKFISDNQDYIHNSLFSNIAENETNRDVIYATMTANSVSLSVELATQLTLGILDELHVLPVDLELSEQMPSLSLIKGGLDKDN